MPEPELRFEPIDIEANVRLSPEDLKDAIKAAEDTEANPFLRAEARTDGADRPR